MAPEKPIARVRTVDPQADDRWDAFVREHPRGRVYQLAAWAEILAAPFRATPRFLALVEGDRLRGVFPLMRTRGFR